MQVIQRYQFEAESLRPFEPNGDLPTGKFFPTVEYQYFSDGSQLNSITFPQRMYFDARDVGNQPLAKASSNATLLTCDPEPPPNISCNGTFGVGILHNENPLTEEQSLRVIAGGQTNVFLDLGFLNVILPTKGITTSVDNFHQSPQPAVDPNDPTNPVSNVAIQNQSIDLPGPYFPGCPGCVHIHWRWASVLDATTLAGQTFGVDPTFNNNGGKLFIPSGSNQDVDLAIVQANPNEEHPLDFKTLANGDSLLPSDNPQPVFWYAGTGHLPSDKFFIHGGGFSTLYTNRITTTFSGPITFNIEHSHDVTWGITVIGLGLGLLGAPAITAEIKDAEGGVLPAGSNDFTLQQSVTKPYVVLVQLQDNVTHAKSTNFYVFADPRANAIEP